MDVSRPVILDLLPLYLSEEASPATRALVEEFLRHDPELARQVQRQRGAFAREGAAAVPPPEAELRWLRRTRGLLTLQHWLFGIGLSCTLMSFSAELTIRDGRILEGHLLMQELPVPMGTLLVVGVTCLVCYFALRRKLRLTAR